MEKVNRGLNYQESVDSECLFNDEHDIDSLESDFDFEDDFFFDDLISTSDAASEETYRSPEARLWYNSNTYNFQKNNWNAIYQNLLGLGQLEKSAIWNDDTSLSLAQFAVSKLACRLLSIRKWSPTELKLSNEYRLLFLKLVDRTIELKPNADKYRSSKAYFFYMHYLSNHHKENDFQEACELLEILAKTPYSRYKDAQRYIKIRQHKWEGFNHKDESKLESLCTEYEALIEIFASIDAKGQSRFQRNYISCEYNYVKIIIRRLWIETQTVFFSFHTPWTKQSKYQEWEKRESDSNIQRKEDIRKCWVFLNDISERIPDSESIESVQSKNKVRFFEINYRKAQLLDIQGMLCFIVGTSMEKITYFSRASCLLKQTYEKIDTLLRQGARFNYPWYLKCPYALAEFAIKHYESASTLLLSVPDNVNPYGYYIQARNLLRRMLPFFSSEVLFQNIPDGLHSITKFPITKEIISDLQLAGYAPQKLNNEKYRSIMVRNEPIGYSVFIPLLSEIYLSIVHDQSYQQKPFSQKQEVINHLRSAIIKYVHYTPENEELLKTPDDRLAAMYYVGVHRMMTPANNRNSIKQYMINRACSAIFEKEIITALMNRKCKN